MPAWPYMPRRRGCAVEQAVAADAEVAHAHLAAEMLVQARREGALPAPCCMMESPEHGHDAGSGQGVVLLHDHLGERGGGAGDVPGQHAFGKVCPEAGLGQRRGVAVVSPLTERLAKDAHKIAGGDLFAAGIIKADGDGAARLHGQRDPVGKTSRWGNSAKLVSPCTVSGRTVSGTRRPFASARPMVALPTHGTVGIIVLNFTDGAAGKIVGAKMRTVRAALLKGCAEISVCATAKGCIHGAA